MNTAMAARIGKYIMPRKTPKKPEQCLVLTSRETMGDNGRGINKNPFSKQKETKGDDPQQSQIKRRFNCSNPVSTG